MLHYYYNLTTLCCHIILYSCYVIILYNYYRIIKPCVLHIKKSQDFRYSNSPVSPSSKFEISRKFFEHASQAGPSLFLWQKHLIVLPDLQVRDLIFRMVFKTLKFGTFTAEQYSFWFGTQLRLFLTALSPKDLQLIPLDVDCQSHQHLLVQNHFSIDIHVISASPYTSLSLHLESCVSLFIFGFL